MVEELESGEGLGGNIAEAPNQQKQSKTPIDLDIRSQQIRSIREMNSNLDNINVEGIEEYE